MNVRAREARLLPLNNLSFRNRILAVEESDYRKEIENSRQHLLPQCYYPLYQEGEGGVSLTTDCTLCRLETTDSTQNIAHK